MYYWIVSVQPNHKYLIVQVQSIMKYIILRSQRISYLYRETPRCPSVYVIDLKLVTTIIPFDNYLAKVFFIFNKSFLFNYVVFEFTPLLVIRPRYSENYIVTISSTSEWASTTHAWSWWATMIFRYTNLYNHFIFIKFSINYFF